MINTSVQEHLQQERLRTVLREAVDRYNNELMDDEERQLLADRSKKLRTRLALS